MTSPTQDLDALFDQQNTGGGGAASYAFDKELGRNNKVVPVIGQTVQGEITQVFGTHVRDIDTGDPKLDKNGNKQPQVNITLKIAGLSNWDKAIKPAKDEDGNDIPASEDTGERRIYAKHRMLQAIAKAVKAAGASGAPKVGGHLAIRVSNLIWDEKNPARNPLPDYEAVYRPPVASNPAADQAFAQAAAAAPAAPAAAASPAPAAAAPDPWATAVSNDQPIF